MDFVRRVAALASITLLMVGPAVPAHAVATMPTLGQSPEPVSSLIVHYTPGFGPKTAGGGVRGAHYVAGPVRAMLLLGPALGFGMWRLDFSAPVSLATAMRVSAQLMRAPTVISAEPDGKVSIAGTE